jgi:hypothetical protein
MGSTADKIKGTANEAIGKAKQALARPPVPIVFRAKA